MAQTTSQALAAALSGLSFRNNLNTILAALFSGNSGPTAPSPTVGGMLWLDNSVSPPVLRVRNNANTAWLDVLPETLSAGNFWGNPGGSADKPQAMTPAQVRALLGFPQSAAGLGQWTLVYAATNTSISLPAGGTWAWFLIKRSSSGTVNAIFANVDAGGTVLSAGAASQDMYAVCWRANG